MKNNPFAPVIDPVCKMKVVPSQAAGKFEYNGTMYYFCNIKCCEKFQADPERYLQSDAPVEACCCCSEAFEDDVTLVARRKKLLLCGFVASAFITLLMVVINNWQLFNLTIRQYILFALASIVVLGVGYWLLARCARSIKNLKFNMFTLIGMGIACAYFYSVFALFFAGVLPEELLDADKQAKLHFIPSAMIVTLVMLGQYLEARASAGASRAIRSLLELIPPMARKVTCCGNIEEIPLNMVKRGDKLQVLPHSKIPVDGKVIEGNSFVDESMLTGEALPVEKLPGSRLAAGTLNDNAALIMEALQVGDATLLARIIELVKNARQSKLPIQKLADKVSAVFVPLVLTVALISLIVWGVVLGNWSMALSCFVSVLLASCPCSLGLAAPLAVTVGVGVGAKHGILIKNPAILELLKKVDTLMLDKTGTLTENKPEIENIYIAENVDREEFFKVLTALELHSDHPLARAVLAMDEVQKYKNNPLAVAKFTSIPGQGIKARIMLKEYFLGSVAFMEANLIETAEFMRIYQVSQATSIMLACGKKLLGMVTFGDTIRTNAAEAVNNFRNNNIDLVLLSGDNHAAVKSVANKLGIDEFYAELSPQDKLNKVKARQAFGRYTAMVGDGVNDAPALAAADASIAMGGGMDAALENADITLLAGNIGKLESLFKLSYAVSRNIKQNLLLAFAYNILIIPMAAGAFYNLMHWQFNPIVSSIAMSGSCLLVVGNALRLWKIKLK